MARKSAVKQPVKRGRKKMAVKVIEQKNSVQLTKEAKELIDRMREEGKDHEPGSMEERAFHSYIDNLIRLEEAWARDDMEEVAHAQRVMFSAFDGWQAILKQTIFVPVEDIRQIVYDALMVNADAMPGDYAELSGLERGREFTRVANDLIELLKSDRVKVTEQDMDAAYCQPCQEAIAA